MLTSFNRNFKSRNDGNRLTMNFLASPTLVTAMAFSVKLSFNPATDSIPLPSGESFKFKPPHATELPPLFYEEGYHYLPNNILPAFSQIIYMSK